MRIVCPNCNQELVDDVSYHEYDEYHNATIGHCGKCGYSTHYRFFYED